MLRNFSRRLPIYVSDVIVRNDIFRNNKQPKHPFLLSAPRHSYATGHGTWTLPHAVLFYSLYILSSTYRNILPTDWMGVHRNSMGRWIIHFICRICQWSYNICWLSPMCELWICTAVIMASLSSVTLNAILILSLFRDRDNDYFLSLWHSSINRPLL